MFMVSIPFTEGFNICISEIDNFLTAIINKSPQSIFPDSCKTFRECPCTLIFRLNKYTANLVEITIAAITSVKTYNSLIRHIYHFIDIQYVSH